MKRNLVDEITKIRSHSEHNSRYDYSLRLRNIEDAFEESLKLNGHYSNELIKYIPIATVACIQAFFRSTYKDLIDFGKPFSDNVAEFNNSKNIKFDFSIVSAIQTKIVTVGEFISHMLPCNGIEDINVNLKTITNISFIKEIKKFQRNSIFQEVNECSKQFIDNSAQIISDVQKLFELRHIFCHEFATDLCIDKHEILRCFNNSKLFLNQANEFICELMYPNAPETQTDMNIRSLEEFKKTEKDLSKLISKIKEVKKEDIDFGLNDELFDRTIEQWELYRESKAKLDAFCVEGGTMYSLLYNNSMEITTKEKIESLTNEFKFVLQKQACQ